MNYSSNSTLCTTGEFLSESVLLRVMLIIRCCIAVCAVTFFAILFRIQGTHLALHSNARILLVSNYIWAILQSLSNLLCHIYDLVRLWQHHDNPCDYLVSIELGLVIRGPTVLSMYGEVWTLLAMAAERGVATVLFRSYDTKKSVSCGTILVFIQVGSKIAFGRAYRKLGRGSV
jgi:hypothetical protein